MGEARRRARSVQAAKPDPSLYKFAELMDDFEGRNNPPPRPLPDMVMDQAMKTMFIAAAREKCLLCQSDPYGVGVFIVPEELRRIGQKVVLYTLCFACRSDVTSRPKVEFKLIAGLRRENAVAVAV